MTRAPPTRKGRRLDVRSSFDLVLAPAPWELELLLSEAHGAITDALDAGEEGDPAPAKVDETGSLQMPTASSYQAERPVERRQLLLRSAATPASMTRGLGISA